MIRMGKCFASAVEEGGRVAGRGGLTYLKTFVLIVFMNASSLMSQNGLFVPTMPAFANMMSNLPYLEIASSTTPSIAFSSAASNWRAWISTDGYKVLSSRLCDSRNSSLKSQM